jgi:uncharacterized damage-inducible protein DinB
MTYYSGKDLARNFRVVRKNTLQIAHDIPEDKYGLRAAPGTRSVAELLAHIAGLTGWQHQLHQVDRKAFVTFEDFGAYTQKSGALEASLTTKPAIIAALESEGAAFAAWLETLDEARLAETVGFPPPVEPAQKSRFEMLLGVKEHEMHHRGQLMLLQRLIGQVPHLTQQRQARQAAAQAQR